MRENIRICSNRGAVQQIVAKLPEMLEPMGIKSDAVVAFQEGTYVVIRVTLEHVDVAKLAAALPASTPARKTRWLSRLDWLAEKLGHQQREQWALRERTAQALADKLPDELTKILADRGLHFGIDVLTDPAVQLVRGT